MINGEVLVDNSRKEADVNELEKIFKIIFPDGINKESYKSVIELIDLVDRINSERGFAEPDYNRDWVEPDLEKNHVSEFDPTDASGLGLTA